MSVRKRAQGDTEIARLFALHASHVAKVNAGDLTEAESDAAHNAARSACAAAAKTPASSYVGLLAKADYIISENAVEDVDAERALKGLRDDIARMAGTLAAPPPEMSAERDLMEIEDPIIDLECCLRLLQVLFEREDPPRGTFYLHERLGQHLDELRKRFEGALKGGAK